MRYWEDTEGIKALQSTIICRCTIVIIGMIISYSSASAQDADPIIDEVWTGVGYEHRFDKRWSTQVEGQFRSKSGLKEWDKVIGQAELDFSPRGTKWINPLVLNYGFRYIGNNDNVGAQQGYESSIRHHFGLSYKWDIDRIALKYKLQYQSKKEIDVVGANQQLRHKLSLRYNIKKWKLDPQLSFEMFRELNTSDKEYSKYRVRIETDYKVTKGQELGMFYMVEKPIFGETLTPTHVIGVSYRFKN